MKLFKLCKKTLSPRRIGAALGATILMASTQAHAKISDILGNLTGEVDAGKAFMISAAGLVGIALIVFGLYKFKKNSDEPGRGHLTGGLVSLVLGVCFLAIPLVADSVSGSMFNTGADLGNVR